MNKFDKALLQTAYNFADLSHCKRLQVGAVIAKDGRPVVAGYNGNLAGTENCCEEQVGKKHVCQECGCEDQDLLFYLERDGYANENHCVKCDTLGSVMEVPVLKTKKSVIHAERNAVYYAAKNGIATDGCDMYITHAPCEDCAQAIVAIGIKRVIYSKTYADDLGTKYLTDNGVKVELIDFSIK